MTAAAPLHHISPAPQHLPLCSGTRAPPTRCHALDPCDFASHALPRVTSPPRSDPRDSAPRRCSSTSSARSRSSCATSSACSTSPSPPSTPPSPRPAHRPSSPALQSSARARRPGLERCREGAHATGCGRVCAMGWRAVCGCVTGGWCAAAA
eukprot:6586433-Prymnesium_polylepis.2